MHEDIFAQTPTYQRLVKKCREEGLYVLRIEFRVGDARARFRLQQRVRGHDRDLLIY